MRQTVESIGIKSGSHPFQRLQAQLSDLILTTPPGERLPAEPDLARQLGVSRATLREAMRTFEGQGLIRRRQGVGTFVVSHTQVIQTGLEVLESIETLAKKINLNVSMGALQVKQIKADAELSSTFGLPEGTGLLRVGRVIQAENRPVAYLIDVVPEEVLSMQDLEGFTGSVLDMLLKRGTPSLANSLTDIQAVAAAPEIARALEIQRGDVLLLFTARLFTTAGRVISSSYSYFLPGYFHFQVNRRVENGISLSFIE
jgi:GntR family transcriptional regulator